MIQVVEAITSPLENLDLVVEAFDKATIGTMNEVVGDFFPPMVERLQESVEAGQATFLDTPDPGLDFSFGHRFGPTFRTLEWRFRGIFGKLGA